MSGAAPIYSFTEDPARAESAVWARFSAAKDSAEFCVSWLAILCLQIERVGGGLLLLGPDKNGAYVPAAVWPHAGRDVQYLSPAAERTLNERRGIVVAADGSSLPIRDQRVFVGYPIEVSGTLHGAVVLDVAPGPDLTLQRALRLLHWASAWLVDQFRKRALEERDARLARLALGNGHRRHRHAASLLCALGPCSCQRARRPVGVRSGQHRAGEIWQHRSAGDLAHGDLRSENGPGSAHWRGHGRGARSRRGARLSAAR